MDPKEYENIARLEENHWYYAGKRQMVFHWLSRLKPQSRTAKLLDCGAGTGRFAAEAAKEFDTYVLDDHEESLQLLRTRFAPDRVIALCDGKVPLPPSCLDVITALDVLEHIPDDRSAVAGFAELLRPGGYLVVTVPARAELWSDWVVSLHHFRRYDRSALRSLFDSRDWQLIHLNYTNFFAYPAVLVVRKLANLRRRVGGRKHRAEDAQPPGPLNRLLLRLFVWSGTTSIRLPVGVSLIAVLRRN